MENSFYVTLPSNSSMISYPENSISHFTTALQRPLELSNKWEVGLVEANVPNHWFNVDENEKIRVRMVQYPIPPPRGNPLPKASSTCWKETQIPAKDYLTIESLIVSINSSIYEMLMNNLGDAMGIARPADTQAILKRRNYFEYDTINQTVTLTELYQGDQLEMTPDTARLLGYGNGDEKLWVPIREGLEHRQVSLSNKITSIFIYSDIIKYQVVGDTLSPLLRVIPVNKDRDIRNQGNITIQFDNPHFLPISRYLIESIHIDLRTDTGQYVPFTSGRSWVKLHFRTIRLL